MSAVQSEVKLPSALLESQTSNGFSSSRRPDVELMWLLSASLAAPCSFPQITRRINRLFSFIMLLFHTLGSQNGTPHWQQWLSCLFNKLRGASWHVTNDRSRWKLLTESKQTNPGKGLGEGKVVKAAKITGNKMAKQEKSAPKRLHKTSKTKSKTGRNTTTDETTTETTETA